MLGVPVGQSARYFVYVAGGAVIGKILVSLIAPIMGRRVLGVTFWQNEDDRTVAESEFEATAHRGDVQLYSIAMQQSLRPA